MALKRTMESWTSSLRPFRFTKPITPNDGTLSRARAAGHKRSLGTSDVTGASIESPKKTRLDIKRSSIEKTSKLRVLLTSRIKAPTVVRGNVTKRRTLIPIHQKEVPEKAITSSITDDICERLKALELKVEENTELAQCRIKELLERNDALVEETDRLRILLQGKIDEIWELKKDGIEAARKLNDRELEVEQLEARLDGQSHAFADLEKKYRTLQVKFSIVKKMADFWDSESTTLRNLLDVEQVRTKEVAEALTTATAENSLIRSKLRKSSAELQNVHNRLLEAQGNIQVYAKIRPRSARRIHRCVLKRQNQSIVVEKLPLKNGRSNQVSFKLDGVFDTDRSMSDILDAVKPLIQSAVNGHNVCILTYGSSGTGKTHTMEGRPSAPDGSRLDDDSEIGIVPRAFMKALEFVEEQSGSVYRFTLEASFIEIRNDIIYDLLDTDRNCPLRLCPDPGRRKSAVAENVKAVQITSSKQILELMETLRKRRRSAQSKSDGPSPRAHRVYQLQITSECGEPQAIRTSVLNLVKLAAADSVRGILAEGISSIETKNINSTLAALLSVYSSLGSKASHVPYRNSKLTHFLSSVLNNESKSLILAHLSPEEEQLTSSINTLKIAQKFREIHIDSES